MAKTFERADSRNLPVVTEQMIAEFFTENSCYKSSELRSGRTNYGDLAVGFVKLHRYGNKCEIRCSITPEHRIHNKPYEVSLVINEVSETVEDFTCQCEANKGGCKHVSVFLFWLFRRNILPSSTETECYWRIAPMTEAARQKGIVWASEMVPSKNIEGNQPAEDAEELSDEAEQTRQEMNRKKKTGISTRFAVESNNPKPEAILKYLLPIERTKLMTIDCLFISFKKTEPAEITVSRFFEFCKSQMIPTILSQIAEETLEQHTNRSWYAYRIARITASVSHEASRCKKYNGSLMEKIMGFNSFFESQEMERGKRLEGDVIRVVSERFGEIQKAGLFLSASYPHLGASPDGIQKSQGIVFEVKCPATEKSLFKNYINKSGNIKPKWLAQMHIQMLLCQVKKAVFCVARPSFENSMVIKNIIIKEITYSEIFCSPLVDSITRFWEKSVFEQLVKQYMYNFE